MENNLLERIIKIVNSKADEVDLFFLLKKEVYEYEMHQGSIRDSKEISILFQENIKILEGNIHVNPLIKSGFTDLDKEIGGFSPGELIIVGGRPSMGKTQFLVNLALNICKTIPVQYFTYDLSSTLLTNRFISALSGIATSKILHLDLTTEMKMKLDSLKNEIMSLPIYINDSCSNSVTSMKTHCIKQIEEHGVKVIFVDYIQMMSTNRYRNNRELEISYITRELKSFAKDMNVCIIASSQLSRAVETRAYSRLPQLSDLRDSGAIEQDADKVIFIYRPDYYQIEEDAYGNSTNGLVELIVAKNRNGPVVTVKLQRDDDFTTFSDFTDSKNDFTFLPDRLNELNTPPF
jgi:replicative DNA helicase